MWEFSLNLNEKEGELAQNIYNSLKDFSDTASVVTSHKQDKYISILVGVEENRKREMENILSKLITRAICIQYKSEFLDKNLLIPSQDRIGAIAFKKALLNFDRETDNYIVQKNLRFTSNLYLNSFYEFKLKSLKSKWTELVDLANENRDYLISTDAFLDLLKFLVDNLDICEEEIDVFQEDEGYKICLNSSDYKDSFCHEIFNEEDLISSIIDLSPQKINIHCNKESHATFFLEQIYMERVNIVASCSLSKIKH